MSSSTLRVSSTAARPVVTTTLLALLVTIYVVALVRTAWLCDDAYITFRTIENFHDGFGLRYNVDERVQAFTHPLWLFLLSSVRAYSGELYYSTIAVSIAVSIATIAVTLTLVARTVARGLVSMLIVLASGAFVDYSTSGLENPLSHLLFACFVAVVVDRRPDGRSLLWLTAIAALAVTNRPDTALLYAPTLFIWFVRTPPTEPRWRRIALGSLPLVAWETFAIVYYGFPFPNTAYAKLETGIPRGELVAQGGHYLRSALETDPVSLLLPLVAIATAATRPAWFGRMPARALALGVALYLAYVVWIGGDFMAGRFLTLPVLAAVLLLSRVTLPDGWSSRRRAATVAASIVLLTGLTAGPHLGAGDRAIVDTAGIADERRAYDALSLREVVAGGPVPDHPWARAGERLRREGRPVVQVAGGIGLLGYHAGEVAHVLDVHGLSDPLLARLPAEAGSRVGHYVRTPRQDYVDSLRSGRNEIVDPDLGRYYDELRRITRGAILDPRRWSAIVGMNLGRYDGWRDAYLARRADRPEP